MRMSSEKTVQVIAETMSPGSSNSVAGSLGRGAVGDYRRQSMPPHILTESLAMDHEMRELEIKIRSKREEEKRLVDETAWNLSTVSSVAKQVELLQKWEKFYSDIMRGIRLDSSSYQDFELVAVRNLRALTVDNEQYKTKCDLVAVKCEEVVAAHQVFYSSLPLVNEKKKMAANVEKNRILLARMLALADEVETNNRLNAQIQRRRLTTEVVRLAELMVRWQESVRDGTRHMARQRLLERQLEDLENEKARVKEIASSRMQEMIVRIVDRSSVAGHVSERPRLVATDREFGELSSGTSIRSRLGVGGLKLATPHSPIVARSGRGARPDSTSTTLQPISSQAAKLSSLVPTKELHVVPSKVLLRGSRQPTSAASESTDVTVLVAEVAGATGRPALDDQQPPTATPEQSNTISASIIETAKTSAGRVAKRPGESVVSAEEPKKTKPPPSPELQDKPARKARTNKRVSFEIESSKMGKSGSEAISDLPRAAKLPAPELSCQVVTTQPVGDEHPQPPVESNFQRLFPPSDQLQTPRESFDSLFGAIFNTPSPSQGAADFPFAVEDAEKSNSAEQHQSAEAQDFFSFFGSASATNQGPKSFPDDFFKLF